MIAKSLQNNTNLSSYKVLLLSFIHLVALNCIVNALFSTCLLDLSLIYTELNVPTVPRRAPFPLALLFLSVERGLVVKALFTVIRVNGVKSS